MKDYLNTETVPDKVKMSEMLTDLDKRLVSLDMVQGEFELTFEDHTALLAEIDTAATYRDTITDIRVQALQCLDKLTPDIPPTPPSDIGSSSVEVKLPKLSLPTFSGDVLQWQSFSDQFKATVDSSDLPDISKFSYLRSLLEGEAKQAIQCL